MSKPRSLRVALVVMPWAAPDRPPLGVGVLKSVLAREGMPCDVHYLNLRFGRWADDLLDAFALAPYGHFAQWAFAYHLFGPGGLKELPDELEDVLAEPVFAKNLGKFPRERLRRLVRDDVPAFLEHCLADVPWGRYDVVGFSSMFHNHIASLALARLIKRKHPKTTIVLGGANCDGEMGVATLKGCEWVDYVVEGEAEEAFPALLRHIRSGRLPKGMPHVSARTGEGVVSRNPAETRLADMRRVPVPDHDDYFRELEASGMASWVSPQVTFEASRGCWWGQKQHCTFCGLNRDGMTFRAKPAQAVAAEIAFLFERYKTYRLHACDNILSVEHLTSLTAVLAEFRKKHKLEWHVFFETKANLTAAQIETLHEAGILAIQAGIESFSTPVLKLMRKGVKTIQNLQALKACAGRIQLTWGMLWGFPGESPDEYRRIADTMAAATHLQPPFYAHVIRVDRFSPYYFDWRRFGLREPVPMEEYRFLYPEPRFKRGEIAYFFEAPSVEGQPDPADYAEPVIRPIFDHWQRIYQKNYFAYRKGLGFMEVYDSRPLGLSRRIEHRQRLVTGLEAAILEACDEIRPFPGVLRACQEKFPRCSAKRVRRALADLVKRRWVFEEDDSFLFLAMPMSSLPVAQRLALDRMQAVAYVRKMPRMSDFAAFSAAAS